MRTAIMATNQEKFVKIRKGDLPLSCPMPNYDGWDGHPRVFLPVDSEKTTCPYCGTVYELIDFDD